MGDRGRHVVPLPVGQYPLKHEFGPAGGVGIGTNSRHLLRAQGKLHRDIRVGRLQELEGHFLENRRVGRTQIEQRQYASGNLGHQEIGTRVEAAKVVLVTLEPDPGANITRSDLFHAKAIAGRKWNGQADDPVDRGVASGFLEPFKRVRERGFWVRRSHPLAGGSDDVVYQCHNGIL